MRKVMLDLFAIEALNVLVDQTNAPSSRNIRVTQNRLLRVQDVLEHTDGSKGAGGHDGFDRLIIVGTDDVPLAVTVARGGMNRMGISLYQVLSSLSVVISLRTLD